MEPHTIGVTLAELVQHQRRALASFEDLVLPDSAADALRSLQRVADALDALANRVREPDR